MRGQLFVAVGDVGVGRGSNRRRKIAKANRYKGLLREIREFAGLIGRIDDELLFGLDSGAKDLDLKAQLKVGVDGAREDRVPAAVLSVGNRDSKLHGHRVTVVAEILSGARKLGHRVAEIVALASHGHANLRTDLLAQAAREERLIGSVAARRLRLTRRLCPDEARPLDLWGIRESVAVQATAARVMPRRIDFVLLMGVSEGRKGCCEGIPINPETIAPEHSSYGRLRPANGSTLFNSKYLNISRGCENLRGLELERRNRFGQRGLGPWRLGGGALRPLRSRGALAGALLAGLGPRRGAGDRNLGFGHVFGSKPTAAFANGQCSPCPLQALFADRINR